MKHVRTHFENSSKQINRLPKNSGIQMRGQQGRFWMTFPPRCARKKADDKRKWEPSVYTIGLCSNN